MYSRAQSFVLKKQQNDNSVTKIGLCITTEKREN
jgi:hypothetical protein